MTFWGRGRGEGGGGGLIKRFIGKNGALRWNILVGNQKHNVQKPRVYYRKDI